MTSMSKKAPPTLGFGDIGRKRGPLRGPARRVHAESLHVQLEGILGRDAAIAFSLENRRPLPALTALTGTPGRRPRAGGECITCHELLLQCLTLGIALPLTLLLLHGLDSAAAARNPGRRDLRKDCVQRITVVWRDRAELPHFAVELLKVRQGLGPSLWGRAPGPLFAEDHRAHGPELRPRACALPAEGLDEFLQLPLEAVD
mmetsp:Transcript_95812/g.270872  ORF Transcript_95812/g.270872 Transcript_95812/m.270872 type:complete len:202 (-) Transcript_95812:173-778(-)